MVSATKMRRAQAAVMASRAYAEKAQELLAAVAKAGDVPGEPLLAKRPVKKTAVVVMGTDRSLAGAINTNVVRHVYERVATDKSQAGYLAVGRKVETQLRKAGDLIADFTDMPDTPHFTEILPIAQVIREEFIAGKVDQVLLAYPRFVSTLVNEPHIIQLLPAEPPAETEKKAVGALTLFEPSEEAVLASLLPRLIEVQLWQALLETKASEHSSRMITMRNASNNASDLLDELKLSYNQARQAVITTEIAEIAAAAAMV